MAPRIHPVRRWLLVALPLAPLLFSACGFATVARLTINDPIREPDVAFIVSGHTTFQALVQHLGAPDELVGLEHGALALYHFRDARYCRLNLGVILRFWTPVQPDFIFSRVGLTPDVFQVEVDSQWIVQQHSFARRTQSVHCRRWLFS